MSRLLSGLAALLTVVSLTSCAERLFYHPNPIYHTSPSRGQKLDYSKEKFVSADGTPLVGWFIPAQKSGRKHSARALGTIVHIHGNAGNMAHHYPQVSWLAAEGFHVFVFDYRGFGHSGGRPSKRGVVEDAVAAVKHVAGLPGVDPARIALFGQSLGGAIAINAAGLYKETLPKLCAVVVESTFATYRGIVGDLAEGIGLRSLTPLLIGDGLSPESAVPLIAPVPVLFVHGESDRLIDVRHSKVLHEAAGDPKQLWILPKLGHLAPFHDGESVEKYRQRLADYLRQQFGKLE
jgi:fermentation-respiration switch protein FrsA (DUF1100 family)